MADPDKSIYEAQHGGKDAAFQSLLGNASNNTNRPGFFSNDPYNQYGVYMGGQVGGKPVGVMGGMQGGALGPSVGVMSPNAQPSYAQTPYGEAVLAPTQWDSETLRK